MRGRGPAREIVIDPADADVAYCGTFNRGVFRTSDRGLTWSAVNTGLGAIGTQVSTVAFVTIDPSSGALYCCPMGLGLCRSIDGGSAWTRVGEGSALPLWIQALALDPTHPDTLYAGDDQAGMFRSFDGGTTWTFIDQGIQARGRYVRAIAVDPTDPARVFCVFFWHAFGPVGGVYRSVDRGDWWSPVNTGLPDNINFTWHSLSIDPRNPAHMYLASRAGSGAGAYKSIDGGSSWTPRNDGLANRALGPILSSPSTPDKVWAGGEFLDGGVLASIDGASSWRARNEGLTAQAIFTIVRSRADVFAAGRGAVFRLNPTTRRFEVASHGLPIANSTDLVYRALAANPRYPEELILGNEFLAVDGVFKTRNAGDLWALVGAGAPGFDSNAKTDVRFSPATPETVFLATGFSAGMYRSVDGGDHYAPINDGLAHQWVSAIAIDPVQPQRITIGTDDGGIYRSSNSGASWSQSNTGINDPAPEILDLVLDPRNPAVLYAVNLQNLANSLYKSEDRGVTWFPTVNDLPVSAERVVIDPHDGVVYVVGEDWKLYRSSNGGASWSLFQSDRYYTGLYPDPDHAGLLWATTIANGVVLLGNDPSLPDPPAPPGSLSWIGTAPNPCGPPCRVSFMIPAGSAAPASLTLHDLSGRIVRTLEGWADRAGRHDVRWDGNDDDGTDVPNGIYFARMAWNGQIRSGKLVVAR